MKKPFSSISVATPTLAAIGQAAAYALASLLFCQLKAADFRPPNVVLIQADDAGWGDYSFNGNKMIHTPNIDSIAKNGVAMDRFYVCPVCSPTRAELLTGRYHLRCGVTGVSLGQERLNLDEKTIANHFKTAGYTTGAFGKWHNGSQWPYHPMARGFDAYVGHTSGHWGEYFDPPLEHEGRMQQEKGYIADICTDYALNFIERSREKPFSATSRSQPPIRRGPLPKRTGSASKREASPNTPQSPLRKIQTKRAAPWPWSRTKTRTWEEFWQNSKNST